MPLRQRIAIFFGLWLLAGLSCAALADYTVEAGESEFEGRLLMVSFAPFISAAGIAFALFPEDFSPWEQRDHYRDILGSVVLACILLHSIVTLTRRNLRQFMGMVAVEAVFLVVSVACALSMYAYWDANGHG